MDSEGRGDGAFRHGRTRIMTSPSSGVAAHSTSDKVSGVTMCSESSMLRTPNPNGVDHFYSCNNWDLLVSLNQSGNLGGSAPAALPPPTEFIGPHSHFLENQTLGSPSNLAHIPPSHSDLADDMVPNIPGFGSETFFSQSDFANMRWLGTRMPTPLTNISEDHYQNSQERRKRKVSASPENAEDKQQKDPSGDTANEANDKQQKLEQNVGQKFQSKQAAEDNNGGEPSKENYIHVRAKRGQATNSHSLAERVRRERISERMRLLQELVPGCNKITGKAMMLDEIINYVQSLQQQVEFLSMKLATVNPELNLDIDRILSKEILHLHASDAATPVITSRLSSLHRFPGCPLDTAPATTPTFLPPPQQHLWNSELQSILHAGFDPNPSACSLGLNGISKTEL